MIHISKIMTLMITITAGTYVENVGENFAMEIWILTISYRRNLAGAIRNGIFNVFVSIATAPSRRVRERREGFVWFGRKNSKT